VEALQQVTWKSSEANRERSVQKTEHNPTGRLSEKCAASRLAVAGANRGGAMTALVDQST
jgi:hypothetical protein